MVPEQIIVTGEMTVPESYQIMANPVHLSKNLTGSFIFDNQILNSVNQLQTFEGNNFSYVQDIKRGNVLRLPENASINLGKPENYGLRNSSFTVSCFVKFTEILEFGDNAILGNYERGYRKGLHLILRSGHPYFGLWANDFVSKETLEPNIWYHLTWRYVIETGEHSRRAHVCAVISIICIYGADRLATKKSTGYRSMKPFNLKFLNQILRPFQKPCSYFYCLLFLLQQR
jgi:hypothetical protein